MAEDKKAIQPQTVSIPLVNIPQASTASLSSSSDLNFNSTLNTAIISRSNPNANVVKSENLDTNKSASNVSVNMSANKLPKFLLKVYSMLEENKYSDAISWTKDGKGIEIKNEHILSENVLSEYFRHNNYTSFVRQLNMYGFNRVNSESNEVVFMQPLFQKGKKDNLKLITRKKTQKEILNSLTAIPDNLLEYSADLNLPMEDVKQKFEFSELLKEVRSLKGRQREYESSLEELKKRNNHLEQENNLMWEAVERAKMRQNMLNERMHKIFLVLQQLFSGQKLPAQLANISNSNSNAPIGLLGNAPVGAELEVLERMNSLKERMHSNDAHLDSLGAGSSNGLNTMKNKKKVSPISTSGTKRPRGPQSLEANNLNQAYSLENLPSMFDPIPSPKRQNISVGNPTGLPSAKAIQDRSPTISFLKDGSKIADLFNPSMFLDDLTKGNASNNYLSASDASIIPLPLPGSTPEQNNYLSLARSMDQHYEDQNAALHKLDTWTEAFGHDLDNVTPGIGAADFLPSLSNAFDPTTISEFLDVNGDYEGSDETNTSYSGRLSPPKVEEIPSVPVSAVTIATPLGGDPMVTAPSPASKKITSSTKRK